MFLVQHQNNVKKFDYFIDAWLYCILELKSYAIILEGDDRWMVIPPFAN